MEQERGIMSTDLLKMESFHELENPWIKLENPWVRNYDGTKKMGSQVTFLGPNKLCKDVGECQQIC